MTDKTKEFLEKLSAKGHFNEDYDYSEVSYENAISKVIIIDKKFGTRHLISPRDLLQENTKCTGSNIIGGYWDYKNSANYVHTIGIKSYSEWIKYSKSADRPHYIPSNPQRRFKDIWKKNGGWGGFLGTNRVSDNYKTFPPFAEVKKEVQKHNLKAKREYEEMWDKGLFPNFPKTIGNTYKEEFDDWSDFLGYESPKRKGRKYRSFEEHSKWAQEMGIKSKSEWFDFFKNNDTPDDINTNPQRIFYQEWKKNGGWGGFLATGTIAPFLIEFRPFSEVKLLAHSLGLKSQDEWYEYWKNNKPEGIPHSPDNTYKDEWITWGEFIGNIGDGTRNWYKNDVIYFIKTLETELTNLDSIELITIINSNNLAKKIKEIGSLEDLIATQGGTKNRKQVYEQIVKKFNGLGEEELKNDEEINLTEFEDKLVEATVSDISETTSEELIPFTAIDELKIYDNDLVTASLDDENIDFLIKNKLKKLWNRVLNDEIDLKKLKNEVGGENFNIIKNRFFNEYEEIQNIDIPKDYIFQYQPNLMQKLVSYRLMREHSYGNWSGTGAGKTLSAIFSGRLAGAQNTVIICNNATVEGWVNSIHEYFENNTIYTKRQLEDTLDSKYAVVDKYDVKFKGNENNYLVLNYETFQLGDGDYIVSELLKNNRIDYIILDEVQNVKQRKDDSESIRRNVVNKLIIHSKEKNKDLLVMVMSATPIINNLTEPKKLIELLSGEAHEELETKENIINGIEMYKALTRYGLRYKPNYNISVNEEIIEVDGSHLSDQILKIPKGAVSEFEKVLLKTKLDAIKDKIKKGTLIYTHYVTELSHVIGAYVKDLGFSLGYYTGEDKNGLRGFKKGTIDVLIGSAPIGTGVDGIQYVCNTLIPVILPWTSSEYDQLVGRINRQGSKFDKVNIYIPQVVIPTGNDIWSWDKKRHNIIKFKATLADLALDGRVPKNLLPPKAKLMEQAKEELAEWVRRLANDDFISFEREQLKIPLNPNQIDFKRKQLGDFSELNKSWSTTKSINTHERLKKDPSEWYYYHSLYSEKRKTWAEIPYIEIAKKIKGRPDWVVADFGCGENLLSKEIYNKVHAFDHIAIEDDVVGCDMKNVPLGDNTVDAAVFSLSLMGSNYLEYIKEAYRILKPYGNLFICEPSAKWEGREEILKEGLELIGFKIFESIKNTKHFIYIDGIKLLG